MASDLGRFLKQLHSVVVSPEEREACPRDPFSKTDLAGVLEKRLLVLKGLDHKDLGFDLAELTSTLEKLAESPAWGGPPVWIHGDLYARHLLVDQKKALSGVIDWGDVTLGDPALDLAIAYSLLPEASRRNFWNAYGEVDAGTQNRALFRALGHGVVLLDYGRRIQDPDLEKIARWALDGGLA
jgi:aminoglycoside phosphotransferase (APT) family kinase protein